MANKRDIPYWLIAIVGIGLWLSWQIVRRDLYREIFAIVAQGISITLLVTIVSFVTATVLGLLLAIGGGSRFRVLRECSRFYIEVVRGVPVLVLLFYIAFVGAQLLVDGANWLTSYPQDWGWIDEIQLRDFTLLWRAVLALTISYSAFIAEIFRAGIQSVGRGQVEAADALGLTRWQAFRFIVLPQAIRTILPPLGNDFVVLIKDSALVSVLGVADITQMAKVYAAGSFRFFETYNIVAFIYLVMTIGLSLAIRALERHLRSHERR